MTIEATRNRDRPIATALEEHHDSLVTLCHRFDAATSDLDFIVEFTAAGEQGYAMRYLRFAEALEALFGRPVDLLTERMIAPPHFRETLARTRQQIYECSGAHVTP